MNCDSYYFVVKLTVCFEFNLQWWILLLKVNLTWNSKQASKQTPVNKTLGILSIIQNCAFLFNVCLFFRGGLKSFLKLYKIVFVKLQR